MVHIGKRIKVQLKISKLSASEFAVKINTNRNNVYNIFTRQSIDTELLNKISIILNHNFFKYYNPLEEREDSGIDGVKKNSKNDEQQWLKNQFEIINRKLDKIEKK